MPLDLYYEGKCKRKYFNDQHFKSLLGIIDAPNESVRRSYRCCLCFKCHKNLPTYSHGRFGHKSVYMTCPVCRNAIRTKVKYVNTRGTHLSAQAFTAAGLCFVPYFANIFKTALHECPVCNSFLGSS